jgi:hypothetical protein
MKVAIFGESEADEVAIRVLAQAVVGSDFEPVSGRTWRKPRAGWTRVRGMLEPMLRHLHYHTDADGLIVVLDSNDSPFHSPTADGCTCRMCELRAIEAATRARLQPRPMGHPLRRALGLAPNAIECWLLYPRSSHYCEAAWQRWQSNRDQQPFTRPQMKRALYGTVQPTLAVETQRMVEAARAIVADLPVFEQAFPLGFGAMARELRAWRGDAT